MLATITGTVVKIEPREQRFEAKGNRPARVDKFVEVTLMQNVPNSYEAGKTDALLVRVRSFNGHHEKAKLGQEASFPCVVRAYVPTSQPGSGPRSPVITADCR